MAKKAAVKKTKSKAKKKPSKPVVVRQTLEDKFKETKGELHKQIDVVARNKDEYTSETRSIIALMKSLNDSQLLNLLQFLHLIKQKQAKLLSLEMRINRRDQNAEARRLQRELKKEYKENLRALGMRTRRKSKSKKPNWFHPGKSHPERYYSGGSKPSWLREWIEANPKNDWKNWLVKVDPCPNHESREQWMTKEEKEARSKK